MDNPANNAASTPNRRKPTATLNGEPPAIALKFTFEARPLTSFSLKKSNSASPHTKYIVDRSLKGCDMPLIAFIG
ncbi:hypothetical protein D9M73_276050 [compost metagenome]